jgi:hypothetical protein
VHFRFESIEVMDAARALEGSAAIVADVANFTTIRPIRQVSEII